MVATLAQPQVVLRYRPRGAAREVFVRREPEVLLSGPAGTGKSRAALEKLHLQALKYDGMRGLMLRKTQVDLSGSALVTYTRKVLHPLDGVVFFGGSAKEPPAFRYPNGSELLVGGLDKASKIMSKEFDVVYVNEATEVTEDDLESVTTRLRNWVMPYQQLLADCNPGPPTHWLKLRCDGGKTVMLESRHEDNPELYDEQGRVTERGADYLARLDALTGVRFLRLRKGLWAAAEGLVYEGWDTAAHVVDAFPIPKEWPRYWVVDFGFTNPFVCQSWAEDPDGRLWRYRERYRSQRLVEDHAKDLLQDVGALGANGRPDWSKATEPKPKAVICDHDAEDRATLERHIGLSTIPAEKSVSPGLQAVASRLKKAGDGKPRLFFLRGALMEADPAMADAKRPTCAEQEVEGYVWDTSNNRKRGEEPVKRDDHAMDTTRYMVAHLDIAKRWQWGAAA